MPLSLLLTTPGLYAHYDDVADILFLDLHGQLTLAQAQVAEVALLQLALHRPYARAIISTHHVSGLEQQAMHWLQGALAAGLELLGVRKLSWVCHKRAACLALAHRVLADLPVLATIFYDLEHAVSWLPSYPHQLEGPWVPASDARRTRHLARALQRRLLTAGRPLPCCLATQKKRLLLSALCGAERQQPKAPGLPKAAPRRALHMDACLAS